MFTLKLIHSLALGISSLAERISIFSEWLWERGGNLECWADEKMAEKHHALWLRDNPTTIVWWED